MNDQHQQDPNNVIKEQDPPPESEVKLICDATEDCKPPSALKSQSPETQTSESARFSSMTSSADTKATGTTTRELLRHLGWLMEEVVRGSQEKVGLAQAVYDSVRDKSFNSHSLAP